MAVERRRADHDRLGQAGVQLGLGEALAVRAQVEEAERIGRADVLGLLDERARRRPATRSVPAPASGSGGRSARRRRARARARRRGSATRSRGRCWGASRLGRGRWQLLDLDVDPCLGHGDLILDRPSPRRGCTNAAQGPGTSSSRVSGEGAQVGQLARRRRPRVLVQAVDPDRREPELRRRRDVVEEARADVDVPGRVGEGAGGELVPVAGLRLVGADLARDDRLVERDPEQRLRCGDQVGVGVREDREPPAAAACLVERRRAPRRTAARSAASRRARPPRPAARRAGASPRSSPRGSEPAVAARAPARARGSGRAARPRGRRRTRGRARRGSRRSSRSASRSSRRSPTAPSRPSLRARSVPAAEHDRCVVAAEAERVRRPRPRARAPRARRSGRSRGRSPDRASSRLIVGGTTRSRSARMLKIASIAPARAEAVAGRALRRRDRRPPGVLLAERELDHLRLGRVAERRRGRVRVDVADLGRLDAGVLERHPHRPRRALAGRVGLGDVRRRPPTRRSRAARRRSSRRAPARGSSSSSTSTAAASPITSPSRPLSNGREAPCGIVVAPRERAHRVEAGDRRRA